MRVSAPPPHQYVDGRPFRFAVAVSDFHADLTGSLLKHCLHVFAGHGVKPDRVRVVRVPGAFELPLACRALARSGAYDAVVALGCVIRGETPHDEHVAREAARGLSEAALETGVPMIFGVLTTLNEKQAWARAGVGFRNKGREAALAALSMAQLMKTLKAKGK